MDRERSSVIVSLHDGFLPFLQENGQIVEKLRLELIKN